MGNLKEVVTLHEALALISLLEDSPSEMGMKLEIEKITNNHIVAFGEYHVMDSNGFYVGYERFLVSWPLLAKEQVGVYLSPMSKFAVNLGVFEISEFEPAIEDNEGEISEDELPTYIPSDEDSLYQLVEGIIKGRIEDYEPRFDHETRTWLCGGFSWRVGEDKTDPRNIRY